MRLPMLAVVLLADSGRSRPRRELRGEAPAAPSRRLACAAAAGREPGRMPGGAGVADALPSGPSAATAAARAREAERMPATLSASWEYSCNCADVCRVITQCGMRGRACKVAVQWQCGFKPPPPAGCKGAPSCACLAVGSHAALQGLVCTLQLVHLQTER